MLKGDKTRHALVVGYLSKASDVQFSDLRAYGITRAKIEDVAETLKLRKDLHAMAYALWQEKDGNKAAVATEIIRYLRNIHDQN